MRYPQRPDRFRAAVPRVVFLVALALLLAPAAVAQTGIRVMSFNIRLNVQSDGEHAWPHRADLTASVIRFHRPDVVGLQEALIDQLHDLEKRLPEYAWVGLGRDDGKEGGEFSAILYRTDRLDLKATETFWLSDTPDVPGRKGWDAAYNRVVTWALFETRDDETRFYHFNTHFDNEGETARRESAALIQDRIEKRGESVPVIVTGDFNAEPSSVPYATMTASLHDARLISRTEPHGPEGTFSGFVTTREPMPRIDYIFVTDGIGVERFATLAEHWNGRHASDHLPVVADLTLP